MDTLRFLQARVDAAYAEGVRLYKAGNLDVYVGENEAVGNYMERAVRQELKVLYNQHGAKRETW